MPQIDLEHVTKIFTVDRQKFRALDNVSLTIEQGDFVFLVGSSGAGKTTLLRLLASHINADSGRYWFDDVDITRLPPWRKPSYRRSIGQIWQEPTLIRKRTIRENLIMVQRAMGIKNSLVEENTVKALSLVGMRSAADKYPFELSGGQIKMVELARSVINNPDVLLVDEITANLDHDTGWDIMHILTEINHIGTTVIMATHAKEFVNIMRRRVVTLVAGRVVADIERGKYGEV